MSYRQLTLRRHLPDYGTDDRSRECGVCLSRGRPNKFHKHFSTAFLRARCIARGLDTMDCPTCQSSHPADIDANINIKAFFTSSTLNGFYKSEKWAPTGNYHLETEGVGGLTLDGGRRMWRDIYEHVDKNIDTHVVVGINDILELTRMADDPKLSPDQQLNFKVNIFMRRVKDWYRTVLEHSTRRRLPNHNKFSISNLLRPPQLYDLPGTAKQNYRTYNSLIDAVNREIDRFNITTRANHGEFIGGEKVVGLKNCGMRTNSRRKMSHNLVMWREKSVSNMLHLVTDQQARTAMRVLKYFQRCTPNPTGQYFPDPVPIPSLALEIDTTPTCSSDQAADNEMADPVPVPPPEQSPDPVPDTDPATNGDQATDTEMSDPDLAALDETSDDVLETVDEMADLHLMADLHIDYDIPMDDAAGADLDTIGDAIEEAINEIWRD